MSPRKRTEAKDDERGRWVWEPVDDNLAVVPAPAPVEEREYKVTGPRVVFDTKPGETFKATLSLGQEATLIQSGHIQRVGKARKAGGK